MVEDEKEEEETPIEPSKAKYWFAAYVIGIVAGLQIYAWFTGHNGTVFALTSLAIGGVCGAIFGKTFKKLL